MNIAGKILSGLAASVVVFAVSAVYAGHRESAAAIDAVRGRLLKGHPDLQVEISKYPSSSAEYRYVCGSAFYKDAAGKDVTTLWMVLESGVFPSADIVNSDTDPLYDHSLWEKYCS